MSKKLVYEITLDEKYEHFVVDWIGWYADKIELMRRYDCSIESKMEDENK